MQCHKTARVRLSRAISNLTSRLLVLTAHAVAGCMRVTGLATVNAHEVLFIAWLVSVLLGVSDGDGRVAMKTLRRLDGI